MKKALVFFVLFLLVASSTLQAQNRGKYNGWLQYTGTYSLNQRFDVNLGAQYRAYSGLADKRLLLGLANLQYNLKSLPMSVAAGYMYLQLQPYSNPEETEKFDNRENRLYQQVIVNNKLGRARLLHRYRIEERWTSAGFRLRFRYLASLRLPLGPKTLDNPKWYATIKDEIRISDQENPFDSNRVWVGAGYILNKHLGGELLWMTQFNGGADRANYVAFILRHDFGWSADKPARRPRFLPQ
ncbi:DUF2490 domain-containing protein [Hymenobacter tibetensis]|uniref:DUF2490 domain-containing protein n=1 Tax=Hymenobacter tibetensis TaxID=497967 RepID=A0ABY4D0Z6_9BACT|nr:DUF2490 domain-containing protein [Hymenobacter tibetensis]UOG75717.1 DUF2490 domain-containing protein [Hymenobacter tibetensis]